MIKDFFGKKRRRHVLIIDYGLKDFLEWVQNANGIDIWIGYIGSDGSSMHPDSSVSVATIALFQEFGTEDTPERSFLRSTLQQNQAQIAADFTRYFKQVSLGKMEPEEAYEQIAKSIYGKVKKKLKTAAGWAAPLKSETVSEKGSFIPLDDTGTLIRNLGWAVVKKGRIIKQGKE